MTTQIPLMQDLDLQGLRTMIRLDLNVPIKDGDITSDARIRACYLVRHHIKWSGNVATALGHCASNHVCHLTDRTDEQYRNSSNATSGGFVPDSNDEDQSAHTRYADSLSRNLLIHATRGNTTKCDCVWEWPVNNRRDGPGGTGTESLACVPDYNCHNHSCAKNSAWQLSNKKRVDPLCRDS